MSHSNHSSNTATPHFAGLPLVALRYGYGERIIIALRGEEYTGCKPSVPQKSPLRRGREGAEAGLLGLAHSNRTATRREGGRG